MVVTKWLLVYAANYLSSESQLLFFGIFVEPRFLLLLKIPKILPNIPISYLFINANSFFPFSSLWKLLCCFLHLVFHRIVAGCLSYLPSYISSASFSIHVILILLYVPCFAYPFINAKCFAHFCFLTYYSFIYWHNFIVLNFQKFRGLLRSLLFCRFRLIRMYTESCLCFHICPTHLWLWL